MFSKINNLFSLFLIAGIAMTSCTKTEDLDPLPQDKILEYRVSNLQDTVIYGAIDNTNNTITVYVPFYFELTVIDPWISLSPGARLAGEILPVALDETNVTYTVIAENGAQRTYRLQIIQQNTPSLELTWNAEDPTGDPGGKFEAISGSFGTTSTSSLKIELVSRETGDTFVLNTSEAQITVVSKGYQLDGSSIHLPTDINAGMYEVNVDFLGHHVTMKKDLKVEYKTPNITVLSSEKKVEQGGEITYPASNGVITGNFKSAVLQAANGETYDFPIKSYSRTEVTLTVPEDMPVGSYRGSRWLFSFDEWPDLSKNCWITVEAKE